MKKGIIKNLSLLIIIFSSLTLLSCSNASKKITISEDTNEEVSLEEKEIIKSISAGEKLLDEGKFNEAKESFNRAVDIDKTNKDTYIRIKDKYLSINKLDDAYSIIKTAISNNVDIDNMKLILKEISSKFEVIKLSNSVYQNDNYALPKQVIINISDNSITIPITWDSENVDTSTLGIFTYEGYNDEYGRKIVVELTVLENLYDKQIGYIKNLYQKNGKKYVDVDLIEFYQGNDAITEATKDNKAIKNDDGTYFVYNGYYIRNNYDKITTYEISDDCIFQLTPYDSDPYSSEPLRMVDVNYDILFSQIEKAKKNQDAPLLFWFELKNNSAYLIHKQFLP